MKVKSKTIALEDRRAIVVSDIHGNGHLLKQLLKECQYQPNIDHLILLGDYIEKGKDSLGTLHQIMELSTYRNVEVLMGNCDAIPIQLLYGIEPSEMYDYLFQVPWSGHTLLQEMADKMGLELRTGEDHQSKFQALIQTFSEEFAFLDGLPHVLESEQFLFAHAGLESEHTPYASDVYTIMKNDRFANQDHTFVKTLICGHTPVINYATQLPSACPRLDSYKNIYSIDGGCGVKRDGQLNALIIHQGQMLNQYVDELEQGLIKEDYIVNHQDIQIINWFDRYVQYCKEEKKGVRCIHLSSQKEVVLPKSYLYEEHGQLCTKDFTNYRLSVKQGDVVGIIEEWNDEVFVKRNGIYGWIPKRLLG